MKIIVGTRGSKLATTQTMWVIEKLQKEYPLVTFEMKIIKTKGDTEQEIFTCALEEALINNEIDMAVHSMKEMPTSLPEELCLAPVPLREDARDALILKEGYRVIEDLPSGARIGTDSKRSAYQLLAYREDLCIEPIRGNIDTRLDKVKSGELDGIILAVASLKRLGLEKEIAYCFSIDEMVPAPCEGMLAIEVKAGNKLLLDIISSIEDPIANIQYQAERTFMEEMDGKCQLPMGAYCLVEGTHIKVKGLLSDEAGKNLVIKEMCGPIGTQEAVSKELSKALANKLRELNLLEAYKK